MQKKKDGKILLAVWVVPETRRRLQYIKETLKIPYNQAIENALKGYIRDLHIEIPEERGTLSVVVSD